MKNQNGFSVLIPILAIVAIMIVIVAGWKVLQGRGENSKSSVATSTKQEPSGCKNQQVVELGVEVTLSKNCFVKIADTGLEVGVTAFYNSPCPEGAQCITSGVGIMLEYRLNGETKKGMNLVQAFGYETTLLDTDHASYAKLTFGERNRLNRYNSDSAGILHGM